jgi:hypothetical protein
MRVLLTCALVAGLGSVSQVTADAAQCRGVSFDPACRGQAPPAPTVTFTTGQSEVPKPSAPAGQMPSHPRQHGLVARTERPAVDCKMPIVTSDDSVDLTMRAVKPNPDVHFGTPVITVPRCATETPRAITPHAPIRK